MATQTPPAFNKIGLHTGPGTNPELLYSYLQDLTEAGIPAFITAVSDHTLIQTALSLTRSAELNHTFVFSLPAAQTGGDLFPFDQPDFYLNNKGQEQSVAAKIWRQALGSLPTDFDRERVWLELLAGTPEVLPDRQADWLGEFGVALARMAQQDGFRLALFGWQSGHPRPQSWRTDGMLRLLHRCAESPDQLAISLHEFSGSPETLSPDAPGSGIGRFRAILDAAADQKINPPTLLITAWGWAQERVPDPETAFAHMLDANEQLYAHYPAVRGAALWTLAHELSPVAAQAEALVAPIRELSLDYEFRPDPADAPPYAASFPAQSQTDPYAAGSTAQTPAYLPTETDPYDTTGPDDALDLPSEIDSNEQPVAPSQPAALASTINSFFSEAELRSLSFDLALDYDELPGQDKQSKAQALVSTLASRSRMDALLRLLRRDRPRIPWSDIASGAAPAQSLDLGDATGLRRQIATRFNEDELRSLLFDLQIDYENLPGQNLDAKARELVLFMARRSQTDALLNALRNARPGVDWLGEPRAAAQNTAVSPTSETNTAPPTTADDALSAQSPAYDCQVVNDVTIPPGWRVAAGTAFEKGWRIKNTGTQPLLPHFQVVFVDGHPMGEVLSYPLSEREDWQLAPGRITDLMLPLRAPSEPEDYSAHWRLQNDAGDFFGDTLVVHIAVVPGPQNAADANASDADPATAVSPLPNLADPDADLAAQIQQRPLTKGSPMQQQTTSPFADVDLADFLAETDDDKAADTSAYPLPSAAAAPRRTWLIPANDALTAEIAAKPFPENPAAQPGAACDRLLLLRPAPDPAVTHLARIQVSREPPATPGNTSFSLESGTPLNNPLPWDQLQRHPALANWDQLKAPLTNLQPVPDAVWPPLRGLLLALNPDLAADLAACEETTPAELLTAALAAANTLQDRRARHDFLSPLLPHLATDPDTAPLLDPLLQDADWRVRQAARRALGRTDTPADLFANAETALQAGLPEDALQLLKDHAAWNDRSDPTQTARGFALLAAALERLGDQPAALHAWQQAARLNPADTAAYDGVVRNTPDERLDDAEKFVAEQRGAAAQAAGPAFGQAAVAERRNQFDAAADLLAESASHAASPAEKQRIEARREVIREFIVQPAAPAAPELTAVLDPREQKLIDFLRHGFSLDELFQLAKDMRVNAEDLRHDRLSLMAYDLVRGLSRQNRLAELERRVRQLRPTEAHIFQDSIADLIGSARAMLARQPQRAISFLNDQKDEWETLGSVPERAAIYAILAQAYAAVAQPRRAYLNWQRKAALQPDVADAFTEMAAVAPNDLLDHAESWMQEMRASHPKAAGPVLGLVALAQRRGRAAEAAELLATAPAASLVREHQRAQAAEKLRADGAAQPDTTSASAAAPALVGGGGAHITANQLNLTLDDLAAQAGSLALPDQLAILQAFLERTLALPTLAPPDRRELQARGARALDEARSRGRVTPRMLADLRLPALDHLFVTKPAHRRALIHAAARYRQQPRRRLALFLRAQARRQLRRRLGAPAVAALLQADDAARLAALTAAHTAVFAAGAVVLPGQAPQTLPALLADDGAPPLPAWRLAQAAGQLTITGNLQADVPPAALLRLQAQAPDFWPLLNDLLHNQAGAFRHLDSWERFRRSPLPDSVSSLLLAAFDPEAHLAYVRDAAAATLQRLDLAERLSQLDYPAYAAFAQALLRDPDLGFDSLDDVALFLWLVGAGQVELGVGETAVAPDSLHPPLRRAVALQPAAIDTELALPEITFPQIASALNAGNHVILIGPPGTGKTTVAQDVCRHAHDAGCSRGAIAVTATADWTTFDTVGGYMPTADNRLAFNEGIVLRAIREQKWLIIDEINRADIDKAFGELFTVLSGQPVTLPYQTGSQPIRILPPGHPRQGPFDYVIPPTWRIVGTMNVYDKASLFEMSYAFMRRFAFVDVGIPGPDIFSGLIGRFLEQAELAGAAEDAVVQLLQQQLFAADGELMRHRPLGPAIARDMIRYVAQRRAHTGAATPAHVAEAFLLYAIPQFDGLEEQKIVTVFDALGTIFAADAAAIHLRLRELFPQYTFPT